MTIASQNHLKNEAQIAAFGRWMMEGHAVGAEYACPNCGKTIAKAARGKTLLFAPKCVEAKAETK